ncbi:MAG: sigma-54 dependent transcriptional regulator [candidate division WOR-3 bacterium]
MKKILCIEDDENVLFYLENLLKNYDYEPVCFSDPLKALDYLKNCEEEFPVIITDVKMPEISGLELLEEIKKMGIKSSVLVITAYAEVEDAVKAMRMGATSYLKKPLKSEELIVNIEKAIIEYKNKIEIENLKERIRELRELESLNLRSIKMKNILRILKKAAKSDSPIYITGESGTGKEVLARFIHENSNRKNGPFFAIDCGSIPETLFENELFGHVKGAFTGATVLKKGILEMADGGTVFFDELTNMPLNVQAKLLRVLETKEFLPLGSSTYKKTDIRIIAASVINPEKALKEGKLREDLFYRLKVFVIEIPPLRERKEDILPLASFFLEELEKKYKKKIRGFSKEAIDILLNYSFPGNIRELKNIIEHAYIICEKDKIEAQHLPIKTEITLNYDTNLEYKKAKEIFEKNYLLNLLKNTGYNIQKAAEISGLSRQMIYEKIKKYKIELDK